MATVTRAEVYEYQRLAATVEDEARRRMSVALAELGAQTDLADPASHEGVVRMAEQALATYGSAAAELGRQFYQFCRDREAGDGLAYVATSDYDYYATRVGLAGQVTHWLRMLATGSCTHQGAMESICAALGGYVQRSGRGAILSNLEGEHEAMMRAAARPQSPGSRLVATPRQAPRRAERTVDRTGQRMGYARVPSPGCTCAFCIVMASRGFVYWTSQSAGSEERRYHDNCRCAIVRLDSGDPRIEGYDEGEYLEQYERARDALADHSLPQEVYDRIDRASRQAKEEGRDFRQINEVEIAMRFMYGMT